MHFVNGYPTVSTSIPDENGRMRTYDEYGHRTESAGGEAGETTAKDPTEITVNLVLGSETATSSFYNLYKTDFKYGSNYKTCKVQKGMTVKFTDTLGNAQEIKYIDGAITGFVGVMVVNVREGALSAVMTTGGVKLEMWRSNGRYNVVFYDLMSDVEITVVYDEENQIHKWELDENGRTAATCVKEGEENYTCADCGATKKEILEIEPDAHVHKESGRTESSCTEYGSVTYECENEGCEDSYTVQQPKVPHTWDNGTELKAPSCHEKGTVEFKCEKCELTKQVTVAATADHTWAEKEKLEAGCGTAGYVLYECENEGCVATKKHVIPATGLHVKDEEKDLVLAEPKEDKEGTTVYDCDDCGAQEAVAEKTELPEETPEN